MRLLSNRKRRLPRGEIAENAETPPRLPVTRTLGVFPTRVAWAAILDAFTAGTTVGCAESSGWPSLLTPRPRRILEGPEGGA